MINQARTKSLLTRSNTIMNQSSTVEADDTSKSINFAPRRPGQSLLQHRKSMLNTITSPGADNVRSSFYRRQQRRQLNKLNEALSSEESMPLSGRSEV